MEKNIEKIALHISHTDISIDGRILKELDALQDKGGYNVAAIGASLNEDAPPAEKNVKYPITTLKLFFNKTRWRPHFLRYCFAAIELLSRLVILGVRQRPDVVHCHDTLVLPAGVLIKLFTGCSLIYDAHELESDKNGQSRIFAKATLLIEKICWSRVDALISVSPSILRWYNEKLGAKPNALILNTPRFDVKLQSFKEKKRYFHREFSIPENELVFLYLGMLGSGRGIENLLDVFSSNETHSHIVFMGYGPLKDLILKAGLNSSLIHLHAPVKHDEVVSLTQSADVGLCFIENVSLSDFFCLPNKLFEYAFSGLPILASDFPDMKQVIEEFGLGSCSKNDAESILAAVSKLEGDYPVKAELSGLSELGWEVQEGRLISLYQSVLSDIPSEY